MLVGAAVTAWLPGGPARGQTGAVLVDRDGWWSRANGGDVPLTAPSLPFPVPDKAIAVAASNGEPEKMAAVGIVLDVDPAKFQRLVLNLAEVTDQGANVGVVANPAGGTAGGAVDACLVTGAWTTTKKGAWPNRPTIDATACVPGARSAEGVWSFDLTPFARRWLAGEVPPNGVGLIEHVDPPVSFQVAWGDRTTSSITFSLDLVAEDDSAAFAPIESPDDSSTAPPPDPGAGSDFGAVTSAPATATYEYRAADSFTTPVVKTAPRVTSAPVAAAPGVAPPTARAQPISVQPTKGKLPVVLLLLLVPLGLLAALAASFALGPAGDPGVDGLVRREGGVSRALALRRSLEDPT
jgi:hypothetical protein